jgi:hypothetical protein
MTITEKDAFGWHSIITVRNGARVTLQCFRSAKECRQWVADTARIRTALGLSGSVTDHTIPRS